MAKVTGSNELDMRDMIAFGEVAVATATNITISYHDRAGVFEGDFDYTALGLATGALSSFELRQDGVTICAITGIERSAYTAIGIARTGDNDRFLAYALSGDDRVAGTPGADYLLGFGGDDAMSGGRGDDQIFGGSDDDRLYGASGDDLLAGGKGADHLFGGAGDDSYVVDMRADRVAEGRGGGWDVVLASASFALPAHVEELGLTGTVALEARGNSGANLLRGNSAANVLRGLAGNDALAGLTGDDVLIGGRGRDLISGGRGDDVYRFLSLADSGPAASQRDKVLEFWSGQDRIDLAAIDANPDLRGNQAFAFRGAGAFSGNPAELRVAAGRVSADVDGDRDADFRIDLHELLVLDRHDFIL